MYLYVCLTTCVLRVAGSDIGLAQTDLGTLHEAEESSSAKERPQPLSGWLGFLSLDYYQGFFDVTTSQVELTGVLG